MTTHKIVPVEPTPEMTSAVRAGTIEPQSMTHQLRIVERIKSDYAKLLAAAPPTTLVTIEAARLAELYSLLKRAQQHVPYLGETYRAIDDVLAARGAK